MGILCTPYKTITFALSKAQPEQIVRLPRGKIGKIRMEVLVKLAQVLQISWIELVETFGVGNLSSSLNKTQPVNKNVDLLKQINELQVEYERVTLSMLQQIGRAHV